MKPPVMEKTEGLSGEMEQEVRRVKSDPQLRHEDKIFNMAEGTDVDTVIESLQKGIIPDTLTEERGQGYQPAPGQVMNMFSIPFLRGQLNLDTDEVAEKCRELVAKQPKGDICQEYTTYFDEDLRVSMHEHNWFKSFSNQIKDSYIAFCSNVYQQPVGHLCRDDIHLFAWVNVYTGPHQHSTHNHVNCHTSGTYYVKTTKSNQPIKFFSPNMSGNANHQAVDRPIEREGFPNIIFDGVQGCDSSFNYIPQEGEFLFWPSYVLHSVEPTYDYPEDYERISISFNLKHHLPLDNNETGDNMRYDFLEEDINHERMVGYKKDE